MRNPAKSAKIMYNKELIQGDRRLEDELLGAAWPYRPLARDNAENSKVRIGACLAI
jgi:hypothetical protein